MVYGLWFMVYGLRFMVDGLWFMVYGLWFRVQGLGFRVYGLWFRVQSIRLRVQGSGFRVLGPGVQGIGSRVQVLENWVQGVEYTNWVHGSWFMFTMQGLQFRVQGLRLGFEAQCRGIYLGRGSRAYPLGGNHLCVNCTQTYLVFTIYGLGFGVQSPGFKVQC